MKLRTDLPAVDRLCYALLIIGAVNWGALGVAEINLLLLFLDPVFQPTAADLIARTVYTIIGLAGLYFFYPLYRLWNSRRAESGPAQS